MKNQPGVAGKAVDFEAIKRIIQRKHPGLHCIRRYTTTAAAAIGNGWTVS